MEEVYPGIYRLEAYPSEQHKSSGTQQVYFYLIPGDMDENGTRGRSLLIDTGYFTESGRTEVLEALWGLGIRVADLDVLITHKHNDHCGQAHVLEEMGARIFMNPEEDAHAYDCISLSVTERAMREQKDVLRRVGVTSAREPELYEDFRVLNEMLMGPDSEDIYLKVPNFGYEPVLPGQVLHYGDFHLTVLPLPGHTRGQVGLADEEKRLVFPADCLIRGVSPIVPTVETDEHLVRKLIASLTLLKTNYSDCSMFQMHGPEIADVKGTADKIIASYQRKILSIMRAVKTCYDPMTVKEIMVIGYGLQKEPDTVETFLTFKMMLTKTFSLVEYLFDEGYIERFEDDGMLFYAQK
ncbi:MAG: MBL fold metallo-hydrolase [Lachnospiraceae bacterium]|nr:MBL fold metallo-hydrolase [Lachnospiraceae bacterium]